MWHCYFSMTSSVIKFSGYLKDSRRHRRGTYLFLSKLLQGRMLLVFTPPYQIYRYISLSVGGISASLSLSLSLALSLFISFFLSLSFHQNCVKRRMLSVFTPLFQIYRHISLCRGHLCFSLSLSLSLSLYLSRFLVITASNSTLCQISRDYYYETAVPKN
jgi:hypothetical protein